MGKRIFYVITLLISATHFHAQNTMNIHQNNGNVLSIPMNSIDSITYTITNPGSTALVTTSAIQEITSISATSGGNILSDGGTAVTHRGICWSTNPSPTTANDTTLNGNGSGIFFSSITGLEPNTTYYVRAYATNSAGTAYGNELSFTACENCESCFDGILNNSETNIDCGGPNCPPCDHCSNGLYEPNLGEVWLDCGGECPICPTCANGVIDGDEIGVDCGGSCGGCELLCGDGLLNGFEDQTDCENQGETPFGGCDFCPTCIDGLFNGQEAGIDCGGPNCEPCCSTGNCGNGIQDGAEFFIDCGGNSCPDCVAIFEFQIGGISYATPEIALAPPAYDDVALSLIYAMQPAYDTNPDAPPVPVGTLSLAVTASALGWSSSIGYALEYPIPFSDPNSYFLTYTDELGFTYTTSLPGGGCTFLIENYGELNITVSDLANGCNKPPGLYRFFRGLFSGTLIATDPSAPTPSIAISDGLFQYTFLP
jgi:hypothetical protein